MWLPGDKVFIASFFNESKDEIHPIEFLSLFPHTQQLLIANYSLTTEEIETLLKSEPITHLSLWDCNLSGNHPLRVDSSRDIDIELKRCTLDQNSLSEILSVSKQGRIALIECTLEKASYGDPTLKSQYDRTGRTYVHFSPEIESAIERTNLKVSKFEWMDEHPK